MTMRHVCCFQNGANPTPCLSVVPSTASRETGWAPFTLSHDSGEPRKERDMQPRQTREAVCEQRVQTRASYTDRGGRVKKTSTDFSHVVVRLLRLVENRGFLSVALTQFHCVSPTPTISPSPGFLGVLPDFQSCCPHTRHLRPQTPTNLTNPCKISVPFTRISCIFNPDQTCALGGDAPLSVSLVAPSRGPSVALTRNTQFRSSGGLQ